VTALAPRTETSFDWEGLLRRWSNPAPGEPVIHWTLCWVERDLNGAELSAVEWDFRFRAPEVSEDQLMDALEALVLHTVGGEEHTATLHELRAESRGEGSYRVVLDAEIFPTKAIETPGPREGERTTRYLYEPRGKAIQTTVVVTVSEPIIVEQAA
jgi:hypothetical protein